VRLTTNPCGGCVTPSGVVVGSSSPVHTKQKPSFSSTRKLVKSRAVLPALRRQQRHFRT